MQLYICEKPSQARDLATALSITDKKDGYFSNSHTSITWCYGHLLEQYAPDDYDEKWKRWSIDTLPIFPTEWKQKVIPSAKKQFAVVKALLNQAGEVIIATDADREGETIARSILAQCHYRGALKRLWLTALDQQSIKKALDNVLDGKKTESLYYAGLARSYADWLTGMNLSRLYSLATNADKPLTVGRVQSPTLNLIVQRDKEIENFVAKDYFDLLATFQTVSNETVTAKWVTPSDYADDAGRCLDKTFAENVKTATDGQSGTITHHETNRKIQAAPALFSLSRLQQYASKHFGFSAEQTLTHVQALYETHKATTYPRSDCEYLPDTQKSEVKSVLNAIKESDTSISHWVDNADPERNAKCFNTDKVTAHHAIIPTMTGFDISQLSSDERKLYQAIRDHYIAQFYPHYEYDETDLTIAVNDQLFSAKGKVTAVDGWKAIIPSKSESNQLPVMQLNDVMPVLSCDLKALKTKPFEHYTEGTLIGAMKNIGRQTDDSDLKAIFRETSGLGTEATRGNIIKNLLDRQFIQVEGKHLISTGMGKNLIELLPDCITNAETTAQQEQILADIVDGKSDLNSFITAHKAKIADLISQVSVSNSIKQLAQAKESYPCPDCSKPMYKRSGKFGDFWGCSGYPDCKTIVKDGNGKPIEKAAVSKTDKVCPACQKPMLLRGSKDSQFYGCSGFPSCKQTLPISDDNSPVIPCPECSQALRRRKGTKGVFWGCSAYPKCSFTAQDEKGSPVIKIVQTAEV